MTKDEREDMRRALDELDILARQLQTVPAVENLGAFIAKRAQTIRQAAKSELPKTKSDIIRNY